MQTPAHNFPGYQGPQIFWMVSRGPGAQSRVDEHRCVRASDSKHPSGPQAPPPLGRPSQTSTLQTPICIQRRMCQWQARAQGRQEQDLGPFLQNLVPCLSTLSGRLHPGAVPCLPQRFLPRGSLMNWDSGLGKVTPLNWETRGQAEGVQGLLSHCFPIQKVEIDNNGNNNIITFPWSSQLMQTSTESTSCTSV